jgi:hypothetical protein
VIAVVNLAVFAWARAESRAEYRTLESWTKDVLHTIKDTLQLIQMEMKDFRERIQDIEKKEKKKEKEEEYPIINFSGDSKPAKKVKEKK